MDQPSKFINLNETITAMSTIDEGRSLILSTDQGNLKIFDIQAAHSDASLTMNMKEFGRISKFIDCKVSINGSLVLVAIS